MARKYVHKIHPTDGVYKTGRSSTWKRMIHAKDCTESHMKWIVGKGNFNFWKEHWVLNGKLEEYIIYPIELVEVAVDKTWELVAKNLISLQMMDNIRHQLLNVSNSMVDKGVWTIAINGLFFIKYA